MYERFTDRARKVMALADHEARRLNHKYIGTEHVLLGLIKEGSGIGATLLKNYDLDIKILREDVAKLVKSDPEMVILGELPQTPRAKSVIESAVKYARELNHESVGTEHILYGLTQEKEGIAMQILAGKGLDEAQIKKDIESLLGIPPKLGAAQKTEDYWMIPRDKMSLSEFLEISGYVIKAHEIFTGITRVGILLDDTEEKLSVEYRLNNQNQINDALGFREFLDNNSIKYEESHLVSEVAGKLREFGKSQAQSLAHLADRLERKV